MNDIDENIVSGKLRYQGTLDISFYTIYQHDNMRYKAKINARPGLPKAIYLIVNIVLIIQLVGPCFFVDSSILWDADSVFTKFIRSIGCIWQLWAGKCRIYAGVTFAVIVFLFELLSGIWAGIISKKQVLHKGESYFSLLSAKYLRPIFTILTFSALPEAIYYIKTEKVVIAYLVIFVCIAIIGPFDLYLISARILVENNPNHEWDQYYPILLFLVQSVLVILSASVGFVSKTNQAILMIICAVIYGSFGVVCFLLSPTVKRTFSLIISALCLSGCLVSIISTIFVFTSGVDSIILTILFIVFFIICYIILTFISKKKATQLLMIFSQCESSPDEAEDILLRNFKKPHHFISAVHIVFQYWPPFLLTWKPFSIFSQKYPKNSGIILLWIRICALFPQEGELFRYLIGQYANLKNDSFTRTSFLSQMMIIKSSRSYESTPAIMKNIASINKRIEVAHSLQFRFWERILQKSTDVFWPNVKSISKLLDRVDNDIQQLIYSYPNNKDIVTLYCSFLKNVKFDFIKFQEWSDKLKQLREGISLQPDIAIQSSRYFLPEVTQYCTESQMKKQVEASAEVIDNIKSTEIDVSHLHVKISLQELVNKSRIGSIVAGIIILIIGTILTVLCFVWYSMMFKARYVDDTVQKDEFMRAINNGLFNFGYLATYVAMWPLLLTNSLVLCNASDLRNQACKDLMMKIAPTLYPKGKVYPWTFEPIYANNIISVLREKLLLIQFSLGNLSHSKGAKKLYEELFITSFFDGLTPIQSLLKCSVDATSLLKSTSFKEFQSTNLIKIFDQSVNVVANKLIEYPEKMLEISIGEADDIRTGLDIYFLLSLFVVLVLVALPFNMTYYLLRVESGLVTLAFTSLPNTSVREILSNLSQNNSNNNNNKSSNNSSSSTNAFLVSGDDTSKDTYFMYFVFFLSMIMVIICCLYLYYLSFDYSDSINNNLAKVSSFQQSGIYYLFVLYRLLRAASYEMMDQTTYPLKSFYNKTQHLEIAGSSITRMKSSVDYGLWGSQGTMDSYYKTDVKMDYFDDIIPSFGSNAPKKYATILEELATLDVIQQFDILIKDLHFLQLSSLYNDSLDYQNDKYFLPLVYYGTNFAASFRFTFYNSLMETILDDFVAFDDTLKGLISGVAIVQVISVLLIIFYLNSKSLLVKKALHMFLFFNPQVILQNQNVMLLLTKRSMRNFEDENSYLDAEKVIENTDESALLMDKKFVITDVNNAFVTCIELPKDQIVGKSINEILKSPPDQQSIEMIIMKLNDVFKGTVSPSFREKVSVLIPNGKEKDVVINVICLTSNGTANESNFHEICAMAFIIDDQTEQRKIEQRIHNEKQKITDMLNKVLPESVIEELQKGSDSISLSVHSASVGCIEVIPKNSFDPNDFKAPFQFLSNTFNALDEILKDFPQLTKIRTSSNTYEYAGGLFGSVNKPDKHAEEATRFALKVISSADQISEKVGFEVEFKIGLSTGGPLVAGVLSLNKPYFHLLGPTVDLAQRMKTYGVVNQVQVTRAVYELIYAYNFKVTERGDIDTGGGKVLRTYVINP